MAAIVSWVTESVREILQISELTLQSFLVFCTAFILVCFLLKRRRYLPPYPAGRVPVLGHLLALGRAPHLKLTAWRRQYGDVFTVRMGMEDVVVLNGYTAVKDALVDRSELFASRPENYLLDVISDFGNGAHSHLGGVRKVVQSAFPTDTTSGACSDMYRWNSLPGPVVVAPNVESFRAGLAACPP
ncbi:hypothetical protein Bbelb_271570 [Branchiostoma belcheri]|nr:hypothetical protein Bbelb_271570 [Branchiostoma belcheri]